MCGIAGLFTPERPTTPDDVAVVRRMMAAQTHRGPDGEGLYQAPHAVLGHRRLSIIDLSPAGAQPMSNEDGTIWVTYNGEIYNFLQLRQELIEQGHSFKSRTDSEVLVHGYEEWGIEELLTRLRGMFAFALYDRRRPNATCLFLAKDRFGIKPLYYGYEKNHVVFASEVRAILSTGLVATEFNTEALIRFLQLGSVPIPLTTVKGIRALPAAHYALIDEQGFHLKQYWDLWNLFSHERAGFEEVAEKTRTLLEEAVRLHLISDVPLGVFLSGGLDSSALVALASPLQTMSLTTVSIVFEEQAYSEAPYARAVAERYATTHHEITIGQKDFIDSLPAIFAAMDQPTVDGVNTYLVSKAAKELGLKVVLSGLGGDEVFLGYNHLKRAYEWNRAWQYFRRMPSVLREMALALTDGAFQLTGRMGREKLSYLKDPTSENVHLMFRGLFSSDQIQALLGLTRQEINGALWDCDRLNGRHGLGDALSFLEFKQYLQSQLLKDTDVMSMAHSIETRVPLLDHKVVEYVLGLESRLKLQKGTNKPALVGAMAGKLPQEVCTRQKMGFTFPFGHWIKEAATELEACTLENEVLEPRATRQIWRDFQEARLHWSRPWALLVASQTAV